MLREGGFTIQAAAHAISAVDSYVHGFVLEEVNLLFRNESELAAMTGAIMDELPSADFPYLYELTIKHVLQPGYNYGNAFDIGLEVVLDGIHANW
jgi:hypothetical protein